LKIDHVLFAATDLVGAAASLERTYGLPSAAGGRHPGWGTENRIVPLGETYLELIAIVDEAEAASSVLGRWVKPSATTTGRPIGWCVQPDDLDATARRLGLEPQEGSRVRPDGEITRWRTLGVDEAFSEPALPFFIERPPGTTFPGSLEPGATPTAVVSRIELEVDAHRLEGWLGPHTLPIGVRPGRAGLRQVVLTGAIGEIVFGPDAEAD
jgi:hypothetical protein